MRPVKDMTPVAKIRRCYCQHAVRVEMDDGFVKASRKAVLTVTTMPAALGMASVAPPAIRIERTLGAYFHVGTDAECLTHGASWADPILLRAGNHEEVPPTRSKDWRWPG